MNELQNKKEELNLDPENWEVTSNLAHKMLDDMLNYTRYIKEEKIWNPIPDKIKQTFKSQIPTEGLSLEEVYKEFKENILPFNKKNLHPLYWGWVDGSGTVTGLLSDMIAAAMNPNVSLGEHSACYVENQVMKWNKELFEYGDEADGILVSGASMANLFALATARNIMVGKEIRKTGLSQNSTKYTLYCSDETHSSVQKAVELLGIGSNYLRKIPVDQNFRINLEKLSNTIEKDKSNGFNPICIIANVGTVNTGAIDPIKELSELCSKEKIWLHIDGAFGAWLKLLPEYNSELKFMNRADSIAFDFHKWIYLQYDISCVMVKKGAHLNDTFELNANYLLGHERGLASGENKFMNKGIQLSRSFRALKVWFSIKENGLNKYRDMIRQNVRQAHYLEERINESDKLELLTPVKSNIVCFRLIHPTLNQADMNKVNKNIVMDLQEKGIAITSSAILNNNYAIRVAITNHRSKIEDFNVLIESIIKLGNSYL